MAQLIIIEQNGTECFQGCHQKRFVQGSRSNCEPCLKFEFKLLAVFYPSSGNYFLFASLVLRVHPCPVMRCMKCSDVDFRRIESLIFKLPKRKISFWVDFCVWQAVQQPRWFGGCFGSLNWHLEALKHTTGFWLCRLEASSSFAWRPSLRRTLPCQICKVYNESVASACPFYQVQCSRLYGGLKGFYPSWCSKAIE